jgi:hypothetical protein
MPPHPLQGLPKAHALPQQRGLPLQRPNWPADTGTAATGFETMVLEQVLRHARQAGPGTPLGGDQLLGAGKALVDEQVDRQRAALIARAAPLGVARLLEGAR